MLPCTCDIAVRVRRSLFAAHRLTRCAPHAPLCRCAPTARRPSWCPSWPRTPRGGPAARRPPRSALRARSRCGPASASQRATQREQFAAVEGPETAEPCLPKMQLRVFLAPCATRLGHPRRSQPCDNSLTWPSPDLLGHMGAPLGVQRVICSSRTGCFNKQQCFNFPAGPAGADPRRVWRQARRARLPRSRGRQGPRGRPAPAGGCAAHPLTRGPVGGVHSHRRLLRDVGLGLHLHSLRLLAAGARLGGAMVFGSRGV